MKMFDICDVCAFADCCPSRGFHPDGRQECGGFAPMTRGEHIKIASTCRHCAYGFDKSGCEAKRSGCHRCKMYDKLVKCKCLGIKEGENCPYFAEEDA